MLPNGPPPRVSEAVSAAELFEVISAAASQDPARVHASTERLKEMMSLTGTYHALHEIASQKSVPLAIRQQSLIQFKNVAHVHWRSRRYLSDAQRAQIRLRSLAMVDETDPVILQCNEAILARIARSDYPSEWPSLVQDLCNLAASNLLARSGPSETYDQATLVAKNSLRILNKVLKEFQGMKMLNGIRTMGQIVLHFREFIYGHYGVVYDETASALNVSSIESQRLADNLLLMHLFYKSLYQMSTWLGSRTPATGEKEMDRVWDWYQAFFEQSAVRLKSLVEGRIGLVVELRASRIQPTSVARFSVDILTRHVRLYGKLFRRLQKLNPVRFVSLPLCDDLVRYFWDKVVQSATCPPEMTADSNEAVFPTKFLVQGMSLFKESLPHFTPLRKDNTPNKKSLSEEYVKNAVHVLVTKFIPLNPADLELWSSDPEEWFLVEGQDDDLWEFEPRPCAERVLTTLCNQYQDYVTPLLEAFYLESRTQVSADLPVVIQKEAIYCALGRCANRLSAKIPFEEWLSASLSREALETNPNYPILKRRIAWLIGKWSSISGSLVNLPGTWTVLVHLLQGHGPGSDSVVRMTAVMALKECVDTLAFDLDVFAPFLPAVATALMGLLAEAETLENKRRIANSLNIVIERVDVQIVPFVALITQPLPTLWLSAGNNWLLKATLLVTVTKVVEAIREHSLTLGALLVPIIQESLSTECITHLDEDALMLWLVALRNTNTIGSVNGAPALVELYPLALHLLQNNLDLLGRVSNIFESYFVLDGALLLQNYATETFTAYASSMSQGPMMTNRKDEIISLNLLVQVTPSSLWGNAVRESGLLIYLLKELSKNDSDETTLLTEYIYFFSRMILSDRGEFFQSMEHAAQSMNLSPIALWEGLLDQWWEKFDNMSEPRHRKLTAMGSACLVSTGHEVVLRRLPTDIFSIWLDVFGENKEEQVAESAFDDDGSPPPDNLKRYWEQDEPPASYFQNSEGTPEYTRRRAIFNRDVVRTTELTSFVNARVEEAQRIYGGPVAFHERYLKEADPTVLERIRDEGVICLHQPTNN